MPKIVFSEARNFPDLAKFYLNEVIRRNQKLVGSLLREGIKRGEFRNYHGAVSDWEVEHYLEHF